MSSFRWLSSWMLTQSSVSSIYSRTYKTHIGKKKKKKSNTIIWKENEWDNCQARTSPVEFTTRHYSVPVQFLFLRMSRIRLHDHCQKFSTISSKHIYEKRSTLFVQQNYENSKLVLRSEIPYLARNRSFITHNQVNTPDVRFQGSQILNQVPTLHTIS